MGQVLHGSATTTEAVRRAIQHRQASLRALAKRYGINQKTVAKWKGRTSVADAPAGPKEPRSTALSVEEEAVVVAFRRHALLPLDDCLYALQPTIPRLTRSSLHRCLKRHGVSRSPQVEGDKEPRRSSRPIRSASSTSTSPKCKPRRASSISSSPLIELPSSRSLNSSTRPICRPRAPSSRPLSPPCPTGARSCSPTTESNSPTCQRTDQAQPPSSAAILSTASVGNTGSTID